MIKMRKKRYDPNTNSFQLSCVEAEECTDYFCGRGLMVNDCEACGQVPKFLKLTISGWYQNPLFELDGAPCACEAFNREWILELANTVENYYCAWLSEVSTGCYSFGSAGINRVAFLTGYTCHNCAMIEFYSIPAARSTYYMVNYDLSIPCSFPITLSNTGLLLGDKACLGMSDTVLIEAL